MLDAVITSKTRARLLELLLKDPLRRHYLRGLERELGESATPIRRELLRLERAGFLAATDEGNIRYYAVNRRSPLYAQLTALSGASGAPVAAPEAGAVSEVSKVVVEKEEHAPPAEARAVVSRSSRLARIAIGVVVTVAINVGMMFYVDRRLVRLHAAQASGEVVRYDGYRGFGGSGAAAVGSRSEGERPSRQQASYLESSSPRFRVVPGTW